MFLEKGKTWDNRNPSLPVWRVLPILGCMYGPWCFSRTDAIRQWLKCTARLDDTVHAISSVLSIATLVLMAAVFLTNRMGLHQLHEAFATLTASCAILNAIVSFLAYPSKGPR